MLRWITAVLTLVVLAGAYFTYTQQNDLADARGALKATQARAEAQLRVNEMTRAYAAQLEAQADTAEAAAVRSFLRAERAEAQFAVAKTPQDSLPPALAARDAYRDAYAEEKVAAGRLRARGDSLAQANEHLTGIVRDYGDASTDILDATKPSFFGRLLPEVGIGAAAGIDPFTRRPSTTVGVTLSWRIL